MRALFIYDSFDFERGLDPKKSMGIGMEGKLNSWLQSKYGLKPSTDQIALEYAVMGNHLEFVKYLIGVKKAEISDTAINVAFQNHVDDEIKMWLITKGDQNSMDYLQKKTKQAMGESVNFERGLDPKDSLKIGIRNKRSFKTVRECAEFFINNISKLSEGRFKSKEELIEAFKLMGKTNKNPHEIVPPEKSPLRMSKEYLDGFRETDNKGITISYKYPPIYTEEWGTTFDQLEQKLNGLRDFHIAIQKVLGI